MFVSPFPVFGGPHNQALQLTESLRSRGWDTQVVLPTEPGSASSRLAGAGIPVVQVPLHRPRETGDARANFEYLTTFRAEVKRLRGLFRAACADLVVLAGLINLQPAAAAALESLPIVWQFVDTRVPSAVRRPLAPIVTRLADCVMSTGEAVAAEHLDLSRIGDRLVTFFPPVDTDRFAPDANRRATARRELGLGTDDIVIGSIGNLNPQKDHFTFVRAAATLRASGVPARFVLLGAQYENHAGYVADVRALAASLGLEVGTDLLMEQPGARVAELAPALDVFWLTSEPRSEGIPTGMLEAMALAIPVVATDVGSVREALPDGEAGFVVPPRAPDVIAARTAMLLSDPAVHARLGRSGRALAEAKFSLSRCADVHVRAFELALRQHDTRAHSVG